jgi:heterodisulfide reductase subunit C
MKYTPRQVMNLLQLGCADEAVASGSGLLCTACYSCTFRCPRGVAVTDMMAAVQRLNLARNLAHRDIRRFYRTFMRTVERHGRFHEVEFLVRYFLPNPVLLTKDIAWASTLARGNQTEPSEDEARGDCRHKRRRKSRAGHELRLLSRLFPDR